MDNVTYLPEDADKVRKRVVKVFRGRGYKRRSECTRTPAAKRIAKRRAKNKVARASRKFNRQRAKGRC
jgi:hypothetical protein